MITVDLDDLIGVSDSECSTGLIVRMPTGVLWTRQAGGTSCAHPSAEGLFLPLLGIAGLPFLYEIRPDWAVSLYDAGLDRIQADVDAAGLPLRLARWRLRGYNSGLDTGLFGEAWLPFDVVGSRPDAGPYGVLAPFAGSEAILTYPNSD